MSPQGACARCFTCTSLPACAPKLAASAASVVCSADARVVCPRADKGSDYDAQGDQGCAAQPLTPMPYPLSRALHECTALSQPGRATLHHVLAAACRAELAQAIWEIWCSVSAVVAIQPEPLHTVRVRCCLACPPMHVRVFFCHRHSACLMSSAEAVGPRSTGGMGGGMGGTGTGGMGTGGGMGSGYDQQQARMLCLCTPPQLLIVSRCSLVLCTFRRRFSFANVARAG